MATSVKRSRGVAAGLSSETVVKAATLVVERVGFAGMSLRVVAAELGVSPTAIYHHVAGKDELIDAVADEFVDRLLERPLPSDPLRRVRELARRLRQAGLESPGLLSAVVGHVPAQTHSAQLKYAEELLSSLVAAGASEQTAILLYSIILRLCLGDAVALTNVHAPAPVPLEDRLRALAEQTEFPLAARMAAGTAVQQDRSFDDQLEVVLRALDRDVRV